VLGAFFYAPQAPDVRVDDSLGYFERKLRFLKSRGGYPGENKTVFVAVVSRMIIVPLLLLPFIALIARYDLFKAAEDPVFILSAVLLVSSVSRVSNRADSAPRLDPRPDHSGRFGRRVRAAHLKDDFLVIRRVDSAVSASVGLLLTPGSLSRTSWSGCCLERCSTVHASTYHLDLAVTWRAHLAFPQSIVSIVNAIVGIPLLAIVRARFILPPSR
jgi:hypothetical protein